MTLFASQSLRVDVGGVPAVDGLSLASSASTLLVLGAARALFEAAAAIRPVQHGEVRVQGESPLRAVRSRISASAPLDPPLPSRWTALEYATWSARLVGRNRHEARTAAEEVFHELELVAFAQARLGAASATVRRATVVAAAAATGAPVLLIEDPIEGLKAEESEPFARVMARVLARQKTIYFAARIGLRSPVALAAEEAIVVEGSHIAAQGTVAEIASRSRLFSIHFAGDVAAFTEALRFSGVQVSACTQWARHARLSIDLAGVSTHDVLRLAAERGGVVLELRPLARTFA